MTQNRRRPTPGGGSRRPQVAGLRKPASRPSPRPRPTPQPRPETDSDTEQVEAGTGPDTEQVETGTESGTERDAAAVADEHAEATEPASARPRPRAKSRDEGIRKPDSPDETVSEPSALPESAAASRWQRREASWPLTTVIAAVALVIALTAAFFAYKYFTVNSGGDNKAMVDVVATEELKQQVSNGLEAMFSYDYNDVDKHEQAVEDVLATDAMREQYQQFMGDVKDKAPQQKVVLQTTVRNIAVIEMNDDTARVLAFIDQTSVREDTGQSATTGDQPTVTAMRVDGEWKIADIDAYADPRNHAPVPDNGGNGDGGDGGDNGGGGN